MVSIVTSALILLPFLSVALYESGTRNALLSPRPNNSEVYLTSFIIVLKITQLQNKYWYRNTHYMNALKYFPDLV
jgi:hypothetical protein